MREVSTYEEKSATGGGLFVLSCQSKPEADTCQKLCSGSHEHYLCKFVKDNYFALLPLSFYCTVCVYIYIYKSKGVIYWRGAN